MFWNQSGTALASATLSRFSFALRVDKILRNPAASVAMGISLSPECLSPECLSPVCVPCVCAPSVCPLCGLPVWAPCVGSVSVCPLCGLGVSVPCAVLSPVRCACGHQNIAEPRTLEISGGRGLRGASVSRSFHLFGGFRLRRLPLTPEVWAALEPLAEGLKELDLSGQTLIADARPLLRTMPQMRRLSLRGSSLAAELLKSRPSLPAREFLNLVGC